jgi:hypothetical protein
MAASSADGGTDTQIGPVNLPNAFLSSLHPHGDSGTVLLSTEWSANRRTNDLQGDVVVLAMTGAQCRDAAQREALVNWGVSALAPNGIMWVEVPGQWRSALTRALHAKGLVIGVPTARRVRSASSTYFALTNRGLGFALSSGHLSQRWRLALVMLERVPWGSAMLLRFLPSVGFPAFRPGTKPFGWLVDRLTTSPEVDVVLKTSWRGPKAPFLVFALTEDTAVIAKRGDTSISHEAEMLKLLGAGLEKSGLEVPRVIGLHKTSRLCSLIETTVPGRPLDSWIRAGHFRDFRALVDRLAAWICRWNSQTVRHVEFTERLRESLILSPAREVVDTVDNGGAYLDWLSRECERLIGHKVPLVAAHNDLTMANVLGDVSGIRSVVDWEAATPDGLPLADFRYAACDAATALSSGDRLEAFRACFLEDGERQHQLRQCEARLRAIVGGPPEWLELCVHSGWLRHAANEQDRSSSSFDGAFIGIAGILAKSVQDR